MAAFHALVIIYWLQTQIHANFVIISQDVTFVIAIVLHALVMLQINAYPAHLVLGIIQALKPVIYVILLAKLVLALRQMNVHRVIVIIFFLILPVMQDALKDII